MGGLANSAALLEDNPSTYTGRVPVEDQLAILNNERSDQLRRYGKVDPALDAEIENAKNPGRRSKPVASFGAPAAIPVSSLSASADALDDGGAPTSAPIPKNPASAPSAKGFWETLHENAPFKTQREIGLNVLTGQASQIAGGYGGVVSGLKSLASGKSFEESLDDAVKTVNSISEGGTYQPKEPVAMSVRDAMAAPTNPLNWWSAGAHKAGEAATDITGSPLRGTMVETGLNAVPYVLGLRSTKAKSAVVPEKVIGSSSIAKPQAVPAVTAPTDELTIPPVKAGVPVPVPTEAPAEAPKFTEVPEPTPGQAIPKVAPGDQAYRKQVLSDIGIPNARRSSLEGNPAEANTDLQMSKETSDRGKFMKAQLDSERAALTSYADKIAEDTGGSTQPTSDAAAMRAKGNIIASPFDGLKQWIDSSMKRAYGVADARAADVPAEMPSTHAFIGGDQAAFIGSVEGEKLLGGIQARMKSLGLMDKDGNPIAGTVKQAEQLKQYLNDQWQPRTSRLISGMKDAIDEDVTKAAGEDVYKPARALRALRSQIFENDVTDANGRLVTNGVGQIFDASGKRLKVLEDAEKVPDAITTLPSDQFGHVVKTLDKIQEMPVPDDLKAQALAAKNEIKGHFASKVRDLGNSQETQWNSKGITKFLNANSARLPQVFTPDEMMRLGKLNEAGQFTRIPAGYPGADVQKSNLGRAAVGYGAPSAGASVGALVGGALGFPGTGATLGGIAGTKGAMMLNERAALAAAKERMVPLNGIGKP